MNENDNNYSINFGIISKVDFDKIKDFFDYLKMFKGSYIVHKVSSRDFLWILDDREYNRLKLIERKYEVLVGGGV